MHVHGDPTGWVSCNEQYVKSVLLLCPVRDKMLVNPDKERSPGVWQRTHKLLA
jgi:hypothetical protein